MNQVEQIARTFGVDWPHLIAQTVSFSIVCALLYWLAYRPILTMLAARREQIATGLANAAKIKAELDKTEAQRQAVLAQAHAGERRSSSRRLRRRQRGSKRRKPSRRTSPPSKSSPGRTRPRRRIARRCSSDLKREVGRLVLQTTASVTGKILTPDDQRRLAEETAKQLRV